MKGGLPEETTPDLPSSRIAGPALPPLGNVLAVAGGGMIGAVLRVGFAEAFPNGSGRFPWTTFAENVTGALLLGFLLVVLLERLRTRRDLRPFLATGVLGSFTTFSNFTVEIVALGEGQRIDLAALYALASIGAGLGAAALGMMLARRLLAVQRVEERGDA